MTRGFLFFFFNDTAPTEIYPLSLHDALPICHRLDGVRGRVAVRGFRVRPRARPGPHPPGVTVPGAPRGALAGLGRHGTQWGGLPLRRLEGLLVLRRGGAFRVRERARRRAVSSWRRGA